MDAHERRVTRRDLLRLGVTASVAALTSLMLAGCDQTETMPDKCNVRLAVVSPDPARVVVGEEVALVAQLTASAACLPSDAQPGNLRWTSGDAAVATVDVTSGLVKGITAGSVQISLMTATTHTLLTTSEVQVDGR